MKKLKFKLKGGEEVVKVFDNEDHAAIFLEHKSCVKGRVLISCKECAFGRSGGRVCEIGHAISTRGVLKVEEVR